LLAANGVDFIEDFLARTDDELLAIDGIKAKDILAIRRIIEENIEVIEEEMPQETLSSEEGQEAEPESEVYECPDCGALVTPDMTNCPQCGVALSFEYEDESADDQES